MRILSGQAIEQVEIAEELQRKGRKTEKGKQVVKHKKLGIVGALAVVVLAVAYVVGRQYYGTHFYPHTVINQVDCSNLTADKAAEKMASYLEGYELTIHDEVTDMTVSAQDVGLELAYPEKVEKALKKQNQNGWIKELGKEHGIRVKSGKLNRSKMEAYVNTLECMNPTVKIATKSAKVVYSDTTKQYEIEKEVIGNKLSSKKFYDAVESAMTSGKKKLDLSSKKYYKQPKYEADDKKVLEAQELANQYLSAVIQYEDGDFNYTVDKEGIHQFVCVKKNMKVTFDKDQMIDYVVDNICPVFNTIGTTRSFYSPGSGNITVSGGAYGWRINVKEERHQLKKEIKAGTPVTRKPIYMQEAKSREKGNDIGASYVDVSIAHQHLWVIEDGNIVFSSDFVSGNPNLGRQTDKGVHFVEYKRTNYDMSNYNVSVKYWLPFNTAEGEGFHDATWRNTFGGSYYLKDGSHGCINLPLYAAQNLYNMLPCGYPVVVH